MKIKFTDKPKPTKAIGQVVAGEVFTWGSRQEWYLKLESGSAMSLRSYKVFPSPHFAGAQMEVVEATLTIHAVE